MGGRSVPSPTGCQNPSGVEPRQAPPFTAAQEFLDHPFVVGWPELVLERHGARFLFAAAVIDKFMTVLPWLAQASYPPQKVAAHFFATAVAL